MEVSFVPINAAANLEAPEDPHLREHRGLRERTIAIVALSLGVLPLLSQRWNAQHQRNKKKLAV
jgi:hypothetical protein